MMASENLKNKNLNKPDPLEIKTFDLNSSSMIEASAGTGRTFTISNLVVRLLLEGLKMEKEFDRNDVAQAYLREVANALSGRLK